VFFKAQPHSARARLTVSAAPAGATVKSGLVPREDITAACGRGSTHYRPSGFGFTSEVRSLEGPAGEDPRDRASTLATNNAGRYPRPSGCGPSRPAAPPTPLASSSEPPTAPGRQRVATTGAQRST
jgi:hypothetical protein